MPTVRVQGFDGLAPRLAPTVLAPNQAQVAKNVRLSAGELSFWRGRRLELAGFSGLLPSTIYKLYDETLDPIWLVWDAEVDVAPGVLADVEEQRVYYTGDGTPKKTNYSMAVADAPPYPSTFLEMGVPTPTAGPTATVTTAGSGQASTRAYIYTYVSQFGNLREESAPSAPSALLTPNTVDAVCSVTGFAAVPTGDYNITHRRIYRTVTGLTTDSWQFVAEIPISQASLSDNLTAAQLGEVCPSFGWNEPLPDLQGLISLGQGVLAGFVGNTVYFSEPSYAHAWPLRYGISLPHNIVAIGALGSSVVVATEGRPFMIHGTPGAQQVETLEMFEPCVSRRSLVSDESGVSYASPNGLVTIGAGGRGVVTSKLFTRREWQLELPAQMSAAVYDGKYFAITAPSRPALLLSRADVPACSRLDLPALALHTDTRDAKLFYVDKDDGGIYEVDNDDLRPLKYNWRSKRFTFPLDMTFSALKVDADFDEGAEALAYNAEVNRLQAINDAIWATGNTRGTMNTGLANEHEINGSDLVIVPPLANFRAAQVMLYDGDELMVTLTVGSWDPVRIPPFRCRELSIEIRGDVTVRSVTLATTVVELQG